MQTLNSIVFGWYPYLLGADGAEHEAGTDESIVLAVCKKSLRQLRREQRLL